jgi:FkbM family methyltransferase
VLKKWFRDFLPTKFQVPVKFLVNSLRGQLESELKLLRLIIQPNDHTIDIGGNRGVYVYQLWRLGANVQVFEPNPICANVLKAWAEGKGQVKVYNCALSDQAGNSVLHIPQDESGFEHDASASLEHGDFVKARHIKVELCTLDGFEFSNISFIKIDVEGHEASVLRGAEQTIRGSSPALLIEIEQRHNQRNITEIFSELVSWGYRGYFFDKGKLQSLNSFVVDRDQSLNNFGVANARYINNFLFLADCRIQRFEYKRLLQEYAA